MKKIFKSTKPVISALLIVMLLISIMPTYSSAAKKVKLNKTKATLDVGKTVTLKLKNNKKKIKWFTSNKKVATVSKKGKVKAKKKGKATITAKVGKKKYRCKITVKTKSNKKKVTKLPTILKNTPTPTPKPTSSNGEALLKLSNDGKTVLGVYNPDSATVINIPNTVTTLGERSLFDCKNVKTLNIPSSVTTIEMGALPSKLTSIYIPPSVALIGDQDIPTTCIIYGETGTSAEARANEFSCTFIATNPTPTAKPTPIPPTPTPMPIIEAELKLSEDGTTLLGVTNADSATVIKIPNTVTTLGGYSLYDCKHIKTLEIPASVITIENEAFPETFSDIENVYIPSSVTSIGGSQSLHEWTHIYVEADSYAEQWVKNYGLPFIIR